VPLGRSHKKKFERAEAEGGCALCSGRRKSQTVRKALWGGVGREKEKIVG